MDPARFVGSAWIRAATVLFAGSCVTAALLERGSAGAGRTLAWLAIGSGLVAFIGLIHSFSSLYAAWLGFAERAQTVVVGVLFGGVYLLVVPVFRLITLASDPLRLRKRSRPETFWIRRQDDSDPSSLERMG
jgi:hypothetical protein